LNELMNEKTSVLSLMLCLIVSACYQQQPLSTVPPVPATRIVAELTDSGTVAMGNALGAGALQVEGVVSSADENAWTFQMLRVDHRDGRSIGWNRELVSFPRTALANPKVVVLDKRRSWLAAGGITIGALLLARAFNLIGAEADEDDTPQPQESVLGGGGR
jgi:hypothetical protein